MSERALITGGGGFIGMHLARALAEKGYEVVVADSFARAVKDRALADLVDRFGVRIADTDLLVADNALALGRDFAVIYHLAAIIGVRHVLERPFAVLADNVALTANALELAKRQNNLERFVFASSSEVTAGAHIHLDAPVPTPEDIPLALTDIAHPRTSYMLSKIYGEAMCRHAGVPFTIVRPHNVYGPRMGMAHVVPELLKRAHDLKAGGKLDVASVDHRRAFCYADDAVDMIFRLSTAPGAENGTFNVGNQTAEMSIGDLAAIVVSVVGRDAEINPLPPTPGSPTRRCPDMRRTAAVTGFVPAVSVAEGVARTYAWYRDNVFAGAGMEASAV